jgi:two-component system response regulator HydG
MKTLERENRILRQRLTKQYCFQDIIGKSPKMHAIFELVPATADLSSPVLLRGESGTGKELIARAIHNSGNRAGKPFVSVSCASLAGPVLESELFGCEEKGTTGVAERQKGKLALVDAGTIYLGEVSRLPPNLQLHLLRVLREHRFNRSGSAKDVRVEARVIAGTNTDLRQAVAEGRFRDDLFYYLNVVEICIPPLRERREDIPLLTGHFIEVLHHELGRDVVDLTEDALKSLFEYGWPDNVRELEKAVERAILTAKRRILTRQDFAFLNEPQSEKRNWTVPSDITLDEIERMAISATLHRTQGNIKAAAASLGIDRSTMYDKIRRYRIPKCSRMRPR